MGYRLKVLGLLMCFSVWAAADNVFTEDLEIEQDSVASDNSGDELEDLDDLDVRGSELPECLAGLFAHDTLILGCDLALLPSKIVVRTKDGDVVYKLAPQFMLGDTTLLTHHPADSVYHNIWTNARVNPYDNLFDKLKEDVHISMAGFR